MQHSKLAKLALFGALVMHSTAQAENNINFEWSGFARIVAGVQSDDDISFRGYSTDITLDEDSLAGVQGTLHLSSQWSFTSQLLWHSSEFRDSGVEWAYLTYQPNDRWQYSVGKLRAPFALYSDVRDVGIAYPWVRLPSQVYDTFLFSDYTGGTVRLSDSVADLPLNIEVWGGSLNQDIDGLAGQTFGVDVGFLGGIIASLRIDNWSVRAAYTTGNGDLELDEINSLRAGLNQAGFSREARALETDFEADFVHLAANYDNLDYFFAAEFIDISSDIKLFPDIEGGFVSAGVYQKDWTFYATLAASNASFSPSINSIPLGLAPQLDQLSLGFDQVLSGLVEDDLQSLTLGSRWHLTPTLALKTEVSFFKGNDNSRSFALVNTQTELRSDRDVQALFVALDWVF